MKREKWLRNGQVEMSFGMIFSIILIVIFLVVAFYAIKTFFNIQNSTKESLFVNDFQVDIDRIWKSTEGSDKISYVLPSGISDVCFVDFDIEAKGDRGDIYSELEFNSVGEKNLVFYPAESSEKMGAKIKGVGTHTIKIDGVKHLKGVLHNIIFDPIEAATFIIMGACVPGKIIVKNVNLEYLDLFLEKLKEIGVNFEKVKNSVIVSYSPNLNPIKIQALPYPGFPTDFLPIMLPLLLNAKGKSLVHDPLYENRFNYVQQLRKMGADIEIVDPHRAFVFGPSKLSGLTIESWDIRAGACLIVAGLMAEGKTTIENIFQIDRGYEKIEERLQKLGADIKRISA